MIDVCILIDQSGSIRDSNVGSADNWQILLNFVQDLATDLVDPSPEARVSAVAFRYATSPHSILYHYFHNIIRYSM